MQKFVDILEEKGIKEFLQSRSLLQKYKLAKQKMIFNSRIRGLDFKRRKPDIDEIYSFRINQKRRAYGYYKGNYLIVSQINDHQ